MRAGVEPIVQMRSGLRNRIGTRNAECVEAFRACSLGKRGLQLVQI
jgi:hypothetical protein